MMQPTPGRIERLFVMLVFFLGTGALIAMFRLPDPDGDPWAASAQDPVQQLLWLGVYAVTLMLLVPHRRQVAQLMAKNKWIPALMIVVLLSAAWSPTPTITLRRSIAIDLGGIFGYYLAIRFSSREVVRLLAVSLAAALVLSVLFIVGLPSYGVYNDQFRGATWRGVFLHKQPLGRAAALGVLAFLLQTNSTHRRYYMVLLPIAFVLVFGSASSTAVVTVVVVLLCAALTSKLRRRGSLGVPAAVAIGASVLVISRVFGINVVGAAFGVLGKDATLTGRTGVWNYVVPEIAQHPLLGRGVSGFWRGWSGEGSARVWQYVTWHPVHAHNGFLDLALDVGLVGLVIFLMGAAIVLRDSWARYRESNHFADAWPLLFMAFLFVQSMTESVLVRSNSIFWMLYVFTAASVVARRGESAYPVSAVGPSPPAVSSLRIDL